LPDRTPDASPDGAEIPAGQQPHVLNPKSGYVITANNRPHSDAYPHDLGSLWIPGYRAMRIEEILSQHSPIPLDATRRAQADLTSPSAAQLQALIRYVAPTDNDIRVVFDELMSWDGVVSADSRPALIFEALRRTLLRRILEPSVPGELLPYLMGEGPHSLLALEIEYVSHDMTLIARFLADPSTTGKTWPRKVGGSVAVVEESLQEVAESLTDLLGADRSRWNWGAVHSLTFRHSLGAIGPMGRIFNVGPIPLGGNSDTPFQASSAAGRGWAVTAATQSYRQIIDMGDFGKSMSMHAPGQSGMLGSKHYRDLVAPWLAGEYHSLIWDRSDVDASAAHRLTISTEAGQ
jgi:penicillin amidase